MMVYIITGVPGVGKTSVLKEALKGLKDYKVINYGDLMLKAAKELGLVEDRDEIRKLPRELQTKIQDMAADEILGMKGNIIIDTHASILTGDGSYLPGFAMDTVRKLKPETVIIIECRVEDIAARRARDESRTRDEEFLEKVRAHQEVNRMMCSAYCAASKANLAIIENEEGKLKEAGMKLWEVLK
jgi:adenylate kinase